MSKAVIDDHENNKLKKPALRRLMMAPEVYRELRKIHF
jgi:hypothetical protein